MLIPQKMHRIVLFLAILVIGGTNETILSSFF